LYEYGLIFKDEGQYLEARKKFEEARDTFASSEELQSQVEMCIEELTELDELENLVGFRIIDPYLQIFC
jgi:hypothetical protein